MAIQIGDRVRFKNLGKFKRRPLFPPPIASTPDAVVSPHVYEGELGTVVHIPDAERIAVRPDGKEHAHGHAAGWVFRPEELDVVEAE